ncbi:DUF2252 domain-containing protein [Occallatibacter riparius]|uniref:DUF2252 domain-containing protein n=1 Tax=Occallatibacter riparius TaxID=1002689 RepID=A0A9J7BR53_9BACT|nr:DUF2252 domain-containing protein [Occallatibacter riparius]UWZ85063.1 DUF2252 domain-containing protein [Occallatibacter riparius]
MHWTAPEDRRKLGQARRKQVGRQAHCTLNCKSRRTSAWQLLQHAAKGRVPKLVKLKWELMAESPLGYFRGAVPVMAADLAVLPNTGILTQICGDAHIRNVGAFAAPDGRLVFDINDFDETICGPFEWDLKRMAASLVLAGRAAGQKKSSGRDAAIQCITHYAALMRILAKMPALEMSRFQVHRIGTLQPIHTALLKAERATPLHTLEVLTEPARDETDAPRRFKEEPLHLWRITGRERDEVLAALGPYRAMLEPQRQHLLSLYRPMDVAFKVVGTGSVGLRDYCVYFEGNGPGDPLFLQIKEEPASGYAAYLPDAHPPHQNGQRVAEGQRSMQVQSDPFLGWTHMGARDYLVRQLNDHKSSVELEDLAGDGLAAFAQVCGELLARSHARAGDPLAISGYLGGGAGFAEALAEFGEAYADQTEKDWQELRHATGHTNSPSRAAARKKSPQAK